MSTTARTVTRVSATRLPRYVRACSSRWSRGSPSSWCGDPDHPFTRGFLCQKMARYLDRVYSPDRASGLPRRVGRKGRAFRADPLGGCPRRDRDPVSPRSPARPTDRRRFSRTAITGRWETSRRAASTAGSSPAGSHDSRSDDLRFGRHEMGYEYSLGRGRLGADPMAVPGCRFIVNWGSEYREHQQSSLEPDDPARQNGATIVTIDPSSQPDRRAVRLAHSAATGDRCRTGLGPHGISSGATDSRTTTFSHAGPSARTSSDPGSHRISPRTGGGDHRGRAGSDPSGTAWRIAWQWSSRHSSD